jgi:YegS/Rv2252/BmrU family lipid kinase
MPAPRRLLVVYNPTAGRRRRRLFSRVLDQLKIFGCEISLHETRGPGDAESFVQGIDAGLYDAVVAAGGDGTIREVVNGLAGRAIPLGIVPLGTANVLANEIGLSFNASALSQAIARGAPASVYTGEANGHLFLMMAGIGFDARVVEGTPIGLKHAMGKAAYVISTLAALVRHRPCSYVVEIDGVAHAAAAVVIAKGHYYGGRFIIANAAQLSAPVLQVALFAKGRRRDLVRYALALATGQLHTLSNVRVVPAREVRITGAVDEQFQLDGDLAGRLPIFATVAPEPLLLLR